MTRRPGLQKSGLRPNGCELKKQPGQENWTTDQYLEYVEKSTPPFLHVTDELLCARLGSEGHWDFLIPTSLEFRGINDLYNMVMWKLLFVFLLLLLLCLYITFFFVGSYIYCWDKIRDAWQKENRICSFYEILFESRERMQRKIYANLMAKKNIKKESTNTEVTSEYVTVFSKVWSVVIKIETVLSSEAYWVYFSKLEFLWTLVPCVILLFISVPSFTLALALDETHKPASWIKVVGNQWFWVYEYSTYSSNVTLYSNVVYGTDLGNNSLRVLEPDVVITLVNNKFTRLLITSSDVIHCWAVPSLGIKIDACPGRINSISVLPTRVGVYYGQCSEICGVNHAFMPICVEVIA